MTNPNRLTEDEQKAQEEAYKNSTASLDDYDPSKVSDDEKIVEDNNGASMTVAEFNKADKAAQEEGPAPDEGRASAAERKAGKSNQPAK